MSSISLKNVYKIFEDGTTAVNDFNLEISDREFIILVGPSGCGKSTTLRMIAGLEDITKGELKIGDRVVNDVAPKDRDIAMVFQSYALYPHMTVYKNMAFGLELRKVPKDEIDRRVREAAKVLDIEHLLKRKPRALSGGQRQRVALGRAMVRSPSVFLLDEPLSNLDAKLRTTMRTEIKKLHQRLGTTFIYVTHDQTEAMTMGDRIVVMKDGVIQQVDTPQNLYKHPFNMFVAGFIGSPQMNFLDGRITADNEKIILSLTNNELDITKAVSGRQELLQYDGQAVKVGVRPEDLTVDADYIAQNPDKVLTAKLEVSEPMGNESYLYLDYAGQKLTARVSADSPTNENTELGIYIDKLHLFDPNTTVNIIK
ncbi:MAG: sn-glycerol-3-phosphate ABC transporter ATP-binding protein UgpC [Oscillospiraceae bacterium]|nr:sn-glycerol-3-phosphate ABC transporter ATP-binding protein UgpC [Oscillospiraceae bacterium]